jgi:hypothetical protein
MADDEPVELRAATMGRMDRLQASLDAIRDDITVLGGANDRTRLAAQNTRDETALGCQQPRQHRAHPAQAQRPAGRCRAAAMSAFDDVFDRLEAEFAHLDALLQAAIDHLEGLDRRQPPDVPLHQRGFGVMDEPPA